MHELPLLLFTTFAGIAAGLYGARAVLKGILEETPKQARCMVIAALLFLGVGLVCVLFHLGRPQLFWRGLANPSAGIAQEGYASVVFGTLLVIDLVYLIKRGKSARIIVYLGAVSALIFTLVMGLAYYENLGVVSWVSWGTIIFFVAGDVALGLTLYGAWIPSVYRHSRMLWYMLITQCALVIALLKLALFFGSMGREATPFYLSVVLAPAASLLLAIFAKRSNRSFLPAAIALLTFVGVVIARWAFYAASTI